jgi:hypothetical protein
MAFVMVVHPHCDTPHRRDVAAKRGYGYEINDKIPADGAWILNDELTYRSDMSRGETRLPGQPLIQ